MANKVTMEFKKGDGRTHWFKIPVDDWSSGGALFFTAKPAIDNDATDAAAVIDKEFDDTDLTTNETINGVVYKVYELNFDPGDIVGVNFTDGQKKKKYLGEFQFVPNGGNPSTFPDDDNFIEVVIYADVKRGT